MILRYTVVSPPTTGELWLELVAALAGAGPRRISLVLLPTHEVPLPRELPVQLAIERVAKSLEGFSVFGETTDGLAMQLHMGAATDVAAAAELSNG